MQAAVQAGYAQGMMEAARHSSARQEAAHADSDDDEDDREAFPQVSRLKVTEPAT